MRFSDLPQEIKFKLRQIHDEKKNGQMQRAWQMIRLFVTEELSDWESSLMGL